MIESGWIVKLQELREIVEFTEMEWQVKEFESVRDYFLEFLKLLRINSNEFKELI